MGAKKHRRIESRRSRQQAPDPAGLTADHERNDKKIVLAICLILFLFGAYQSVLFYGHQVVPNSDFPGFYHAGRAVLSFKLPGSFKRAPVTGILQNLLTPLMPGHYPDLKAGWLLNAILHPFSGVLLFLIARELAGRAAKWFALVCLLNPWVLSLLVDPIAETTLLFFILLTTWFIFRRSKWSYLFASMATMVRYECAALILAAFVMDMILGKTKKERFLALGLSILASVPLGLWMLGTFMHEGTDATHYFNVFRPGSSGAFGKLGKDKTGIVKHLGIIWSVGYSHILSVPVGADQNANAVLLGNKILAGITFLLGAGLAVYRRSWKVLVLAIFLVPYFLVHAYYPYPIPRFHMPSFWIALLISLYGINEAIKIAAQNRSAAKALIVLQVVVIVVSLLWFFNIVPNLGRSGQVCPRAITMPWVAIAVVVMIGAVSVHLSGYRGVLSEIAVLSILPVVIVSNQLPAAWLLNTGSRDAEFKEVAAWYTQNAREGGRLATTMTAVVGLYLPAELKGKLVSYQQIEGENLLDCAHKFKQKGVAYVAWDSRLGLASQDPYYELYHLGQFKTLMNPQSHGPYKFVKQIRNGNRFVNIFKLEGVDQYPVQAAPAQPANRGPRPDPKIRQGRP